MGIMPTKTELALEQTQQGVSNKVLNIRVILLSIHSDDGNPTTVNIKQALWRILTKAEVKDGISLCWASLRFDFALQESPNSAGGLLRASNMRYESACSFDSSNFPSSFGSSRGSALIGSSYGSSDIE
ncbi:hypothetical protein Tco_1533703 [Tanacetum coccineum]